MAAFEPWLWPMIWILAAVPIVPPRANSRAEASGSPLRVVRASESSASSGTWKSAQSQVGVAESSIQL